MRGFGARIILVALVSIIATFLMVSGICMNFGKPFIRESYSIGQYHWPSFHMWPEYCDKYILYPRNFFATRGAADHFATITRGTEVTISLFRIDGDGEMEIVERIEFNNALELASALRTAKSGWEKVAATAFAAKKQEMNVENFIFIN